MGNTSSKPTMVTVAVKIDNLIHQYTLDRILTVQDLLNLINEYRIHPVKKLKNPTTGKDIAMTSDMIEITKIITPVHAVF